MNKPNRHNTHILETESSKFFNNCIPNDWYIDKPNHDYGVDFNVNITINHQVTGLNFSVQLKSTKKVENEDSASITLKHSTLGFFNTRLEPVLLVIYIQEEKEAYWFWYNELNVDLTSSQKTYRIKIPKTNKLSSINWDLIVKYVQNIFSIKTLVDGIKSLEYEEISNSEILAWKYYYSGDYENAVFYFKNLLRDNPKNTIVLEGLAHSQYMSYNYKKALYNINKAIELSGKPNQYLTKACILAEDGIQSGIKGKIIEAKNIFKRFIDKKPGKDIYHYNYANTLSSLGETQEALKHYKACLKLNPNNARAWKNIGQVYFQLKQHDKELNCYDKALAINPDLPQALFSKGVTLSHIYNQNKEGLFLMKKSLNNEEEMLQNYPQGYFWLASTNEKLKNIEESLKWVNKGLEHYPEDIYFLNFKSNFLYRHWKDNEWLKDEAIRFFEYRLELKNDYKSLYFLIKIKGINNEQEIYELLKKHTNIFQSANLSILKKCNININECIIALLHYDKYLDLRYASPINRYIDHLISDFYSISSEFMDILDLIFATCYSNAISEFIHSKNTKQMVQKILNGLALTPKTIFELIPDENFSQEDAISIMSHIYLVFPTIICREFGVQVGYISGSLELDKLEPDKNLDEQWFEDVREQILFAINKKLKLFKD